LVFYVYLFIYLVLTYFLSLSLHDALPIFTLLLIVFADWVSLAAVRSAQYANLFRLGIAVLPFSLLQWVFSQILRLTFRPRLYARSEEHTSELQSRGHLV